MGVLRVPFPGQFSGTPKKQAAIFFSPPLPPHFDTHARAHIAVVGALYLVA